MGESLKIISEIGASFNDLTLDLENYDVDSASLTMAKDSDYLYVGLYKKFRNLFIELDILTSASGISFEYYNGATWELLTVKDETRSLNRSGFLTWAPQEDWAIADINGESLFYIRMTLDCTLDLSGINMIFSNDNDLKEKYRQIEQYLGNDDSFIAYHQSCRKDIIQDIRNSGETKVSSVDGYVEDLTVWDFLKPEQLRNASAYLCLSKIFAGVSDNFDGKFYQLSKDYKKNYDSALETFLTTIDLDDDGEESDYEASESVKVSRLVML